MITAPAERKLFLIDAFAVIFRAYYAFIKNPRINSKGVNTSAVFGFTNALLDVLGQERPSHLAVVFDAPGDTFRNVQFPAYKANRRLPQRRTSVSYYWFTGPYFSAEPASVMGGYPNPPKSPGESSVGQGLKGGSRGGCHP